MQELIDSINVFKNDLSKREIISAYDLIVWAKKHNELLNTYITNNETTHKQEIVTAWNSGNESWIRGCENAEQYYELNYGKTNKKKQDNSSPADMGLIY